MEKQTDSPDVATPTTTSSLPNTSTVAWSNSPPYLSSRIPQAPFLCSHQKLPTCSPRTDEEEGKEGMAFAALLMGELVSLQRATCVTLSSPSLMMCQRTPTARRFHVPKRPPAAAAEIIGGRL